MSKKSTVKTEASTARSRVCPDCSFVMPLSLTNCPHCARPQFFPNVDLSRTVDERNKLDARFDKAADDLDSRGCKRQGEEFLKLCENSKALFAWKLERLLREIGSETHIIEPFRDLERLRLNISSASSGLNWKKLRLQAETELFGTDDHNGAIHYACLSIENVGLKSYGECTVILKEDMVAHRSSCFEGNSALIYYEIRNFDDSLRSDWESRGKLCFSVQSDKISNLTTSDEMPAILVNDGNTSKDDRFIEVHVFGSMTANTFASVSVNISGYNRKERLMLAIVREKNKNLVINEVTK